MREFREALQLIPKRRSGKLKEALLPELVEWAAKHPEAERISAATVNKLLGGVQAVLVWARDNGMIPDETPWADPFSNMRLEEPRSNRQPWEPEELRVLFGSPVFTQRVRPEAGRGEAAFWLPLLALYTGARLNELAPMTVRDVKRDETSGLHYISVIEDARNRTKRQDQRIRSAQSQFTPNCSALASWNLSRTGRLRLALLPHCFHCSRRGRTVASEKGGQNGLADTNAHSVSPIPIASSIRFDTASRMLCAGRGSAKT